MKCYLMLLAGLGLLSIPATSNAGCYSVHSSVALVALPTYVAPVVPVTPIDPAAVALSATPGYGVVAIASPVLVTSPVFVANSYGVNTVFLNNGYHNRTVFNNRFDNGFRGGNRNVDNVRQVNNGGRKALIDLKVGPVRLQLGRGR